VLLRWVKGRAMRTATEFVQPKTLGAVGRTTARLHAHAARLARPSPGDCPQYDAESLFGAQTCVGPRGRDVLKPREHDVVRRAVAKIRRVMRGLRNRPDQIGLVHGDLEPPNWVFDRGEARPIDFDEFGVGYFLFDLMQVIWTHAMWPDYPAFRASLLDGYESLRPIPADLRSHLDLFQAIPFVRWLDKGFSSNSDEQSDFNRWREPTIRSITRLCDI
jgi:Ser/Thr protein kinase RdoA (MazF antagonist)